MGPFQEKEENSTKSMGWFMGIWCVHNEIYAYTDHIHHIIGVFIVLGLSGNGLSVLFVVGKTIRNFDGPGTWIGSSTRCGFFSLPEASRNLTWQWPYPKDTWQRPKKTVAPEKSEL